MQFSDIANMRAEVQADQENLTKWTVKTVTNEDFILRHVLERETKVLDMMQTLLDERSPKVKRVTVRASACGKKRVKRK